MGQNFKSAKAIAFFLIYFSCDFCAATDKPQPLREYSCMQCGTFDKPDCKAPRAQKCYVSANQASECYMQFAANGSGNDNDFSALGCRNEFENETVLAELIARKEIFLCNGTNCNDFNRLPKVNMCIKCSSENDEACATKPNLISDLVNCGNLRFTQCYQRINPHDNVTTERGCLDELESKEFYNCLTKANELCQTCSGDNCNNAIIPTDRTKCQRCSSLTDPRCHNKPSALDFCPQYHKNDLCVVTYDNGVTKRGCLSEFNCDANSSKCRICRGDGCNTKDLQKRADEYYGIFQDLPLNCYTCSGAECVRQSAARLGSLRKCEGDPVQDCSTVFSTDGAVLRRGCEQLVDEQYASYCQEHPELCFRCKSNGCNTADTAHSYRECLDCDSSSKSDCVKDTHAITTKRKCAQGCLTALYARKNSDRLIYDLVRGCYEDMDLDDRQKCEAENQHCLRCNGTLCNTDTLPRTEGKRRLACQHCQGDNCDEPVSEYCSGYAPNDQCYIQFDNVTHSAIRMGCKSDLTTEQLSKGAKEYFLCDGADCNTYENLPPARICLLCNSTNEAHCSVHPDQVITARRCLNYPFTDCYSRIDKDGTTLRGCLLDLPLEEFTACKSGTDEYCQICSTNRCNAELYPKNRQQCFRCNSLNSTFCGTELGLSQACPIYKANDTCVTKIDENGATYRGCGSELDCNNSTGGNCHICPESNCNTILPSDLLTCFYCIDGDCENVITQKCEAYQAHDQCYISFNEENSVNSMGCRSDKTDTEVAALVRAKKLILCDGNKCNSLASIPTQNTCSVCNSESDPHCATNPNLVTELQQCLSIPYSQCYTRVNAEGHTSRGCVSSLDADSFYNCVMGNDSLCEMCNSTRCNGIDVYPPRRLKCHQCNSKDERSCATAPNSNKVCPIYSPNDACITNLRDCVTNRGCASSTHCDNPEDFYTCRVCNKTACNTANLQDLEKVMAPGRWQQLPLTCRQCQGVEECQNGGVFRTCSSNAVENCVTVFAPEGMVIQRGCSGALAENADYCDSNPKKCPRCNSHGCNIATALHEYVECLACDADNPACVLAAGNITDTRSCYKHCMTALYAREQESNPAYALTRTCLDDLDLDDRVDCEAGRQEFCQACNGTEHCNNIPLPPVRLSCNHCQGYECRNPRRQNCTAYRPHDSCYIRYDEQRSIVSMGCRSEFSNKEADDLLSQGRLLLCAGDNCNRPTPGKSQRCVICNSRSDIKCATNPQEVQSQTVCSAAAPNTGCYSRVLVGGETARGCIGSLYGDEYASCLNGTSATCIHCTGEDNCNNEIFPAARLSCHICSSELDATCEDQPNAASVCPKYTEQEACVTFFSNGTTTRACASSFTCDVNNTETCQHCYEAGCNTANLAKRQTLGSHGKWQDLPLKCLDCSGAKCNNAASLEPVSCQNNNQQDCMTVFDADGKNVIRRGCSDTVEAEFLDYCRQSGNGNCFSCKSNQCNAATNSSEFVDCIYCDSHADVGCIQQPHSSRHQIRKCQGACMTALYAADSSSSPPRYELLRTCLNDKEVAAQLSCANGRDTTCQACYNASCNVEDFPADRLSCYTCSGDECEDPKPLLCPLYQTDDKCFMWFDEYNSITQMGCLSSFHSQDLELLIKTKRVLVCQGRQCNRQSKVPTVQRCTACSSEADVFCATNALQVGTTDTCSNFPHTACYTKISGGGSTVRGCLYDLPEEEFAACLLGKDSNCSVCQGDGCNREVFPRDRLQCYSCNSLDNPTCESFPNVLQPCHLLSEGETCRTALSGNATTVRGCSSEIHCDSWDKKSCRSCSGTACNSIDLRNRQDDEYHGSWQALPLRCHSCSGEVCLNSLGPVVTCIDNEAQDCMTVFAKDGEVQRRGCSDDVEDYEDLYCRLNPSRCLRCKSNECNMAWHLQDYLECVYCNSTTNPLCAINPEALQVVATRTCYKECMVALNGGEVVRSCLDDKELYDRSECRGDDTHATNQKCATCSGAANCNSFIYPADRLRCNVCTDVECSKTVAQYCTVYQAQDFCFALYDRGQVSRMGCASSENPSDIESWSTEGRLYRCEGDECNAAISIPTTQKCVQCDSSLSPECAQNPAAVDTEVTCHAPNSDCITIISPTGDTQRGCASDLSSNERSNCLKAGSCSICNATKCNTEIFPTDRRSCYICNSEVDRTCIKEPINNAVCVKYNANERCVVIHDVKGNVQRGCVSDIIHSENNDKIWHFCDTDLCNSGPINGAASGVVGSDVIVTVTLLFLIMLRIVY